MYLPQVYQRDLIYPHGDHGLGLGIRSYGGLRLTPCARIRRVGLVMDSVSSRSKGTRLGVKRQGALFVARSGCQGLPGAAIDAAGTVGATGEPATKARRLPPVAPTQAHHGAQAGGRPRSQQAASRRDQDTKLCTCIVFVRILTFAHKIWLRFKSRLGCFLNSLIWVPPSPTRANK